MKKRQIIIISSIAAAIIIAGSIFVVVRQNEPQGASNTQTIDIQDAESSNEAQQNTAANSATDSNDQQNSNDNSEPVKQSASSSATPNATPTIYTGYGNNEAKPLPKDQTTSTTCTTDPNITCQLVFTNVTNGQVIEFDAKTTDAQGVAVWSWTGGKEVSSGSWQVQATAGDKKSTTQTVYVQ